LTADLNNPTFKDKLFDKQADWEKEFFNWGAINITQKDTTFSKDPYISFKLILELVNKMKVYSEAERMIWTNYYEDKDLKNPIIPISSNPIIISPTIDFILPGKLPFIGKSKDAKKKDMTGKQRVAANRE
jgi:hypothetical protein